MFFILKACGAILTSPSGLIEYMSFSSMYYATCQWTIVATNPGN